MSEKRGTEIHERVKEHVLLVLRPPGQAKFIDHNINSDKGN